MPLVQGHGAGHLLKENFFTSICLEVIHLRVGGLMGGGAPCVSDLPSHLFGKSVAFQQISRKATERTFRTHIWPLEPRVFVDKGHAMPDGSPALLKTRKHLRRVRWPGFSGQVPSSPLRRDNALDRGSTNEQATQPALSSRRESPWKRSVAARRARTGTLDYLITRCEWFQNNRSEVVR